jgi:hypothetical protein
MRIHRLPLFTLAIFCIAATGQARSHPWFV